MKVITPTSIPLEQPIVTRASTGTYIDSSGFFVEAAIDTPRFSYYTDESGVVRYQGLLVEPRRRNLLTGTSSGGNPVGLVGQKTVNLSPGDDCFVFSFYGTGSVTITANNYTKIVTGGLLGTSRTYYTVAVNSSTGLTFTFTFTGQVYAANVEPLSQLGGEVPDNPTGDPEFYDAFCLPTSWIPTVGSTVTRSADIVSNSGIVQNSFVELTATYSDVISYNEFDQVRYGNLIYESLVGSNLNNTPGVDTTKWEFVKPTNDTALFNVEKGAPSTSTGYSSVSIVFKDVDTSTINSLGAFETLAANSEFSIACSNLSGVDYSYYILAGDTTAVITDTAFSNKNTHPTSTTIIVNLMLYSEVDSEFELVDPAKEVSIGKFITGEAFTLGKTSYGLQTGITDWSTKEADKYGNVNFIIRGFSKKLNANISVPNNIVNSVARKLFALRGKPTAWIATDDTTYSEVAIVFGYFSDFSIVVTYPTYCLCSLEVEGMVI